MWIRGVVGEEDECGFGERVARCIRWVESVEDRARDSIHVILLQVWWMEHDLVETKQGARGRDLIRLFSERRVLEELRFNLWRKSDKLSVELEQSLHFLLYFISGVS